MHTPPIMTVQQHILQEQRRLFPDASGEFSWLLSGITLATKVIADQVRRAGLVDILGSAGVKNVQGEVGAELSPLRGCERPVHSLKDPRWTALRR